MRTAIGLWIGLLIVTGSAVAQTAPPGAELVTMQVQQIVLVEQSPAVLLVDEARQRYLLIFVDFFMANAIRMGMSGAQLERPLTHDLIGILLRRFNARVTQVAITELRDTTYYALISLQVNGDTSFIDARPSDALALAVRGKVPILAAPALLKRMGESPVPSQPGPDAPGAEAPPRGRT